MRLLLLLAAVLSSGCQTAEFAIDHQMTGIHVAAKFEAKDFASKDGGSPTQWNGGDSTATIRR